MKIETKTRSLALILFLAVFFLAVSGPLPLRAQEEVKEVALDFDDVDIRLFIRVISELTGRNFIVDNNVRGKVTVISPRKLTTDQAYEVFKSVLAVNGFALVESGQITKIVVAQNMTGYDLPVHARKVLESEDQFITQIIPIKYLDATVLQPLIKPLLSRQASILVPPSSDLLIATDYKSNIRKIDRLLDEIDVDFSDTIVERLDLEYSSATLVSSKITEILEAKYGKDRKGTQAKVFKLVPIDRINAIISIAPPEVAMEIRSVLAKVDQSTPEGQSLLNVYYLENADAEEMVQILTQTQRSGNLSETTSTGEPVEGATTEGGGTVVGGTFTALGKEISITADKSTNSLVVYAKPDDYSAIEAMIRKLDIPRKQVFLEALIMEVSPNEEFRFGTEWQVLEDVGHPFTETARVGVLGGSENTGDLSSLFAGEDGTVSLGSGFSLGLLGEQIAIGDYIFPSLGILLRAVDSLDSVNVLSKPQVLTLNNETAMINISENRPFQTTETRLEGGGTSQNLDYRDVGIILEITPHINKQGKIRLEINQEVNRISGSVTETQPITRKRVIETVVEVMDGHTVVIGGLIEQQQDFSKGQVPCLGGIPLAGWGFKNVGVNENRTNLLVFLSPHVIDSPAEADGLSIKKRQHMERERLNYDTMEYQEKPWFKQKEDAPPQGQTPPQNQPKESEETTN
jgi:general secretion pathway protein D